MTSAHPRLPCLLLLIAGLSVGAAQAAVTLIAAGQLAASSTDLSGLSDTLENGQPHNLLGGMGSGLAWAGGSTFLAVPDRGPNAVSWYAAVDDTTSYIPRFHTLDLSLTANSAAATVGNFSKALPYLLTVTLNKTTLLYSTQALVYGGKTPAANTSGKYHFSGRSDNFDASQNSAYAFDARLDPEAIRVSRTGKTVFISDEYGPYLYQFDRASGARARVYTLPSKLSVASPNAVGDTETANNTSGRVANKGMEGLAISPDGSTLWGFMQGPLIQDGGDGASVNRIIEVKVASGATKQYAYDNTISGGTYNSSELLAVNDHVLLVLERDGKGLGAGTSSKASAAAVKSLYMVDLSGATDVSSLSGESTLKTHAVSKSLFLDIKTALVNAGLSADYIPAKLEGLAFGPDINLNGVISHTLYIANDNDFLSTTVVNKKTTVANPNQWFVFSFTDDDLTAASPLGTSISLVKQTIAN